MRKTTGLSKSIARALIAGICALIGGFAIRPERAATPPSFHQSPNSTAVINYVIDGDTLSVNFAGKTERVRLIGIDAPESLDDLKARTDANKSHRALSRILADGKVSRNYLRSIIKKDQEVKLVFDRSERDQYGRLLAYVYLSNGEMLNLKILSDGYAVPKVIGNNRAHAEAFEDAFRRAKADKHGIWNKMVR